MTARREPQYRVLGEQSLVGLEPVEAEPLVRMVERQLELAAPASVRAARRLGCEPQADLPHELAPRESEAAASAHPHEVLDGAALEPGGRAPHAVADARQRPRRIPASDRRVAGL